MKVRISGAVLAAATLVSGCATPYGEAPLATNFPAVKQEKLQAAAHWNAIANDVAARLASGQPAPRPLYVAPGGKSDFDRAFTNQLISALVASGQTVLKQPAGALSVETDTQVVSFSPNRPQYKYVGGATALTTGLWALHEVDIGPQGLISLAGLSGLAADAYSWFHSEFATGKTPRTEIIVTASLSDGNQYLSRSTSVYYVADTDKALYTDTPVMPIKVTGGE